MNWVISSLYSIRPLVLTLTAAIAVVTLTRWILISRRPDLSKERILPRQLFIFAISLVGVIAAIISLPVESSTRNQLLGLLGLVLSGTIAFSSTTLVANVMAGFMLRMTRVFRAGDFIHVNSEFGRVTEMGLLDTEIQTDHRELTSIPNALLISNPVRVVRSSGTVISATVSLGYDVHHSAVRSLLKEAAVRTGLEDPFVLILELGDFSISYRVGGVLKDTQRLISARSDLRAAMLTTLHEAGVEIVSPNFMNQRPLQAETRFIPTEPPVEPVSTDAEAEPEAIVFDKADEAEARARREKSLEDEIASLEKAIDAAEGEQKTELEEKLTATRDGLAKMRNDET